MSERKKIDREMLEKMFEFGWYSAGMKSMTDKQLIKDILKCQDINLSEGYRWLDYDTVQELKGLLV